MNMCFFVKFITVLIIFAFVILNGESRKPRLKEEQLLEQRDYRPSKWVANSAMDVWYGNKSMVDIMFREFNEVMNRIVVRPVRSTSKRLIDLENVTSVDENIKSLNETITQEGDNTTNARVLEEIKILLQDLSDRLRHIRNITDQVNQKDDNTTYQFNSTNFKLSTEKADTNDFLDGP